MEKSSDHKDYWSEKRSLASRTGNLIMGSSIGSGLQQGSLLSQSGEDVTFTKHVPAMNAKAFFRSSDRSGDFSRSRAERTLSGSSKVEQTGVMKTLDRLE